MSHGNFLFAWAARNPRKTRSAYDTESVFVGAKSIPTVAIWLRNRLALTGSVSPCLRVWVHCPRASNGLLPRRSYLVGYAQWDGRFDRSSMPNNHSNSFQVAIRIARPSTQKRHCRLNFDAPLRHFVDIL